MKNKIRESKGYRSQRKKLLLTAQDYVCRNHDKSTIIRHNLSISCLQDTVQYILQSYCKHMCKLRVRGIILPIEETTHPLAKVFMMKIIKSFSASGKVMTIFQRQKKEKGILPPLAISKVFF